MPMTDAEILQTVKIGDLQIDNFSEDSLEPASYDLRLGDPLLKGGDASPISLSERGSIIIRAGEFFVFRTHEKLHLKKIISGHLGPKSYFTQRGLILLAGQHVDPGFEGFLLLGAYNASPRDVVVKYLDKICNIEFHKLAQPATKSLREFPQLQGGDIPREVRDYFMGIEPLPLSKLSESLASMANNVSTMSQEVTTLSKIIWRFVVPLISATFIGVIATILSTIIGRR